jgi:hypothetical protein
VSSGFGSAASGGAAPEAATGAVPSYPCGKSQLRGAQRRSRPPYLPHPPFTNTDSCPLGMPGSQNRWKAFQPHTFPRVCCGVWAWRTTTRCTWRPCLSGEALGASSARRPWGAGAAERAAVGARAALGRPRLPVQFHTRTCVALPRCAVCPCRVIVWAGKRGHMFLMRHRFAGVGCWAGRVCVWPVHPTGW